MTLGSNPDRIGGTVHISEALRGLFENLPGITPAIRDRLDQALDGEDEPEPGTMKPTQLTINY